MKKKIGGIDGLQIGEILADFEQDHNEEKAVNSIFDAIYQAKAEVLDEVKAELCNLGTAYGDIWKEETKILAKHTLDYISQKRKELK